MYIIEKYIIMTLIENTKFNEDENMNKIAYLLLVGLVSCTTDPSTPLTPLDPSTPVPIEGALKVNPYGDTPLSAVYKLDKINTEPITVRVLGKTEDMDIAHTYPANYGTELAIHGMYPNYNNTIIIESREINIKTNIMTRPLDKPVTVDINRTEFVTGDPFNQDLYFLFERVYLVAVDMKGEVRYFINTSKVHPEYRVSYTDNKIQMYAPEGIKDLLGQHTVNFALDRRNHHDAIPYKENFLVLANSQWGVEDRLIETTASGTIIDDKTFGSLFRPIVKAFNDPVETAKMNKIIYDDENHLDGAKDWAHANSLVYDEDTDILYFSLRNQAVIAVDYSEWKLLWWMADNTLDTIHGGVPNRGMNFKDLDSLAPYRVKGAGEDDGPKNQHALLLRKNDNGRLNLAMFDNQGDTDADPNNLGSRYVEYAITGDHGNWTATVAHEYRDPNPISSRIVYSRIMSDVDLLPNNKVLILSAIGSTIREVDLTTKDVKFDMTFNLGWVYRADKMPLYPYQDQTKVYSIDYNEKTGL